MNLLEDMPTHSDLITIAAMVLYFFVPAAITSNALKAYYSIHLFSDPLGLIINFIISLISGGAFFIAYLYREDFLKLKPHFRSLLNNNTVGDAVREIIEICVSIGVNIGSTGSKIAKTLTGYLIVTKIFVEISVFSISSSTLSVAFSSGLISVFYLLGAYFVILKDFANVPSIFTKKTQKRHSKSSKYRHKNNISTLRN